MGLGLAFFEMSFNKRIVKKKKMRRRRWSYQSLRDRFSKKMGLGLAFFETSFNKRIVKKEKMGRRRWIYQSLGDGLSQKIWEGDAFGLALRDGFHVILEEEEDGLGFRSRRMIFLEDSRRKRIRWSWVWVWQMGFQRRFEKKQLQQNPKSTQQIGCLLNVSRTRLDHGWFQVNSVESTRTQSSFKTMISLHSVTFENLFTRITWDDS